ncbi:MAG: hypothetical protein QW569_05900 [Candidatus Bathyarchaeia archaeon]|nr:hypothetical protein [Candidatus Bathyarchaeota archaeon]
MTRGIFKALKRGRRGLLAICPRCGSPRVNQLNSLGGWLTPPIYICGECGYAGPILLELEGGAEVARRGTSRPLAPSTSTRDEET